jgi:AraC-like DNA-binding protein
MSDSLRSFFRPSALPTAGVPLGVRSVGEYRVEPGWRDIGFRKSFFQVFWGIDGTGTLVIDGEPCALGPGRIAIYAPGMLHDIVAGGAPWHYRWLTLDGPDAAAVLERLGLHAGLHDGGAPPKEQLDALDAVICVPTRQAELQADALAYHLLCHAAAGAAAGADARSQQALVRKVVDLCRRHWSSPDCTVAFIAEQLGVHRVTLARRFGTAIGTTLSAYLTGMRFQNALSLLRETDLPIAEVARQCGYADPAYFARLFRRSQGMTPMEFRRRPKR